MVFPAASGRFFLLKASLFSYTFTGWLPFCSFLLDVCRKGIHSGYALCCFRQEASSLVEYRYRYTYQPVCRCALSERCVRSKDWWRQGVECRQDVCRE